MRQAEGVGTRILAVEDDERIRTAVKLALEDEGWTVDEAANGEDALTLFQREPADVVLIDIMLPGIDGFEVCRSIRRTSDVPIVMVTARADTHDVVAGLEAGADDYLTKPFAPRELVARVKAILRRTDAPRNAEVLLAGDIEVDVKRREARRSGEVVPLAAREFDLLRYLAENAGLALTRQQLLDGVWGHGWFGDERTVDVHVGQLRKKLGAGLPLATVWGVGYRLG